MKSLILAMTLVLSSLSASAVEIRSGEYAMNEGVLILHVVTLCQDSSFELVNESCALTLPAQCVAHVTERNDGRVCGDAGFERAAVIRLPNRNDGSTLRLVGERGVFQIRFPGGGVHLDIDN